jgi:hypothetical protein
MKHYVTRIMVLTTAVAAAGLVQAQGPATPGYSGLVALFDGDRTQARRTEGVQGPAFRDGARLLDA